MSGGQKSGASGTGAGVGSGTAGESGYGSSGRTGAGGSGSMGGTGGTGGAGGSSGSGETSRSGGMSGTGEASRTGGVGGASETSRTGGIGGTGGVSGTTGVGGGSAGSERGSPMGGTTGGMSGFGGGASERFGETGRHEEHHGHERMSEAREKTTDLMHRASDRALSGLEDGKNRAANELHFVADALRAGVRQSSHRNAAVAPYLERVAEQVDRFSDMVENRSVNDIMRGVQDFARERPALFLGGCFALGVAAARFLKTSEPMYGRMEGRGEYGYESSRGISSGYGRSSGAELGYGTRGVGDTGQDLRSPSAGHTYDADRGR